MHTKPNSKNKSKSTTEGSIIRILSMGNVDLTYTLSLSQEDITKYKIDFEHLSKIEDLSFLYNAKALWVKIFLTTTNPTLSTLLYLNIFPKVHLSESSSHRCLLNTSTPSPFCQPFTKSSGKHCFS